MKYKNILWILMFCVLVSSVYAAVNTTGGYYAFDGDSTTQIDSSDYMNDATIYGIESEYAGYKFKEGKLGTGAYSFRGSTAQANMTIPQITANNFTTDFTIAFWYNQTMGNGFGFIWQGISGVRNIQIGVFSSDYYIYIKTASSQCEQADGGDDLPEGAWTHFVMVRRGSVMEVWENGVNILNKTGCPTDTLFSYAPIVVGGVPALSSLANFTMDELVIYNTAISNADIAILYGNGTGYNPFGPDPTPEPTFIDPTPANNTANDTDVVINVSCSGNNVNLWFDQNSPPTTQVITNSSAGNYTTAVITEGTYYYMAGCQNITSGTYSSNTSVRQWTYDTTQPSITLNPSNEWNNENYSVQSQYDDLFYMNISLEDNILLYGFEINITKAGTVYFNNTLENLTGKYYNYTRTINVSSWPEGTYNIALWSSDAHTTNTIPDYQVNPAKSKITFKTPNENNIKIETDDSSDITATKLIDRYTFNINFNDGLTKTRTFHVKSDYPLTSLPKSPYKAHFVSYMDHSGNWVDFEGLPGIPVITKMTDYHYTVTFENVPPYIVFNSIGGLNINNINFTWYHGTSSFNNPSVALGESFELYINLTIDSTINYTVGNLTFNGTSYVGTVVNTSDTTQINVTIPGIAYEGKYNFTWNIIVLQDDANSSLFSKSGYANIVAFGLGNCTTTRNTSTLIINYYNESSVTTPQANSLEVDILAWITSKNNNVTYNGLFTSNATHYICIQPANMTLFADIYFKYSSGYTHRYYINNGTFNNVSQTINLYNNDATGDSILALTIRNVQGYKYYTDIYASLERYYVDEGLWRIVQMDKSGDFGEAYFNIRERDTDYRLVYKDYDGNILDTSTSSKFSCTSNLCSFTVLLSPYSATTSITEAATTITYNNVTKIFTLAFTHSENVNITFDIFKIGRYNESICLNSQYASSGTLTCNVTRYEGRIYYYVTQDGTIIVGDSYDIGANSLGSLIGSEEGGFWAFVIMMVTVSIGIWFGAVGVVIASIAASIFIYWLGIFTLLTLPILVIIAIIGIAIALLLER